VEAAFPDAGLRGPEGPAADPQVAPADDAAGDGAADQGAGAGAPGRWLQPARGAAGARGHPGFVDHHSEDPERSPAWRHRFEPAGDGLGTRIERWLALEKASAEKAIEITPEQASFLEKLNPCFRERHVESAAPGELLSADTFFVGSLKGVGKVYLHAVADTYGSYAFGFLHVSKQPEAAVAVLHNDVLPFYRNLDLPVGAILTDNGREFCGTERHPYELYLDLNGIEHRRTRVRSPKTNGFVECFNGTVLDEFFRVKMRETFYDSVEALQADLDAWLVHYNTERPHLGYRNMGRRPADTVMSFVSQEG
jgi:transposase InsO family protein